MKAKLMLEFGVMALLALAVFTTGQATVTVTEETTSVTADLVDCR